MLLVIDIGNTNIVAGVFKGDEILKHWRISTSPERTADEHGIMLREFLSTSDEILDISGAIICSVVPELNDLFSDALTRYVRVKPVVVGDGADAGIPVLTDNPREVGADRVVNAVAAYHLLKSSAIVVDFGTAVTFDYITKDGGYAGGAIAPGIRISADSLYKRTAKLPKIDIVKPERIVGRNTVEAMQAGVFYGFIGLVDGIIERMMDEVKSRPAIISTGGLAPLVVGESRYVKDYDEFLTLKGLKIIYEGKS